MDKITKCTIMYNNKSDIEQYRAKNLVDATRNTIFQTLCRMTNESHRHEKSNKNKKKEGDYSELVFHRIFKKLST